MKSANPLLKTYSLEVKSVEGSMVLTVSVEMHLQTLKYSVKEQDLLLPLHVT